MTYSKRVVNKYKGFPYLPVKPYTASVLKQYPVVVVETKTSYRGDKFSSAQLFGQSQFLYGVSPFSESTINSIIMSNFKTELNVEFLNRINQRKVSLVEEGKNFKETIKTIARSVARLRKMAVNMFADPYDFVKRGRKHERYPHTKETFYRMSKSYGDVWLEGRYHWLPTYMTMRDAFIDLQDKFPIMKVFLGDRTSYTQRIRWPRTSYENSGFEANVKVNCSRKLGGYITTQSEAQLRARAYGVGSIPDLAAVAWELTPWSLVVDWVVPVSDILLASTAMNGLGHFQMYEVNTKELSNLSYEKMDLRKGSTGNRKPGVLSTDIDYQYVAYPSMSGTSYSRSTMIPENLDVRPFIAKTPLTVLRALDAISFFSGTSFSKKVLSGKM